MATTRTSGPDTDVSNASMSAAFERAGWTRFAGRREYVADLARVHKRA